MEKVSCKKAMSTLFALILLKIDFRFAQFLIPLQFRVRKFMYSTIVEKEISAEFYLVYSRVPFSSFLRNFMPHLQSQKDVF